MNENETEDDTMQPQTPKPRKPQRRKVPPAEVIRGAPGNEPLLLDAEKVARAGAVVELEVSADGNSILNPEDAGPKEDAPTTDWTDTHSWLSWAVTKGRAIGKELGHQAGGIARMAEVLDEEVPKYLGGGFLLGIEAGDGELSRSDTERAVVPIEMEVEGLAPHGYMLRLIKLLSEFAELREKCIQIRWSTRNRMARGVPLKAKAKPIGLADRMDWHGQHEAPWFLLDLSLPWWLVASDEERAQWLHHALKQCGVRSTKNGSQSPFKRHPDMSAFTDTAKRFGPKTMEEGAFVFAAAGHPSYDAKVDLWGFDDAGQGELFSPYDVGSAVDVDKTL